MIKTQRSKVKLRKKIVTDEIDEVDSSIRQLVSEFDRRTAKNDPRSFQTLLKIRLRHPLFQRISANGFKYLVENSYIYKLKPGQYVYKEGHPANTKIYFILYGSLVMQSSEGGPFGSRMCVGHTISEEVIFGFPNQISVWPDSVLADEPSCVLQVSIQTFELMCLKRHVGAGGSSLTPDF